MSFNASIKIYTYFLIASVLISCQKEKIEEPPVIRPVLYEEVNFQSSLKERTFSGTSRTEKIVNLSFRSSGILTVFNIRLGQQVRKGELLATLDNVQARLNYENAVSRENSAESRMNTSKLNLNRVRKLYEKGGAALSDYESAKNSYKHAEQAYASSKREVTIHKEQIQYGYLVAPENGVIAEVNVELDENISAGEVVAVLNAGTSMEVSLGIPENVINQLEEQMPAKITFPSIPNKTFTGKVYEVAPAIDVNTSTYPVRVSIIDTSNIIRSGMAANVTFDFSEPITQTDGVNEIIIPAKAVGEDSKGRFVFLIESNEAQKGFGIVKKQHIQTGELKANGFVVTSGIREGQKIAVAGLQTLLDGQQVRVNQ